MKNALSVLGLSLVMFSGTIHGAGEQAGHGAHWGYSGDVGPDRWVKLKPEFSACAGKNQSPIDVSGLIEAQLPPVKFDYKQGGSEVVNNGHAIQVNYDAGSGIEVDGTRFDLKQFHFHSPSENRINGKSFPLEAHLVHADKDGNLAVVSVMFDEGKENSAVGAAWGQMPKSAGGKNALPNKVAATGILPADRDYYRYNGSLTTPPCSEGVRWIVMKKPLTVSKQQIETFQKTIGFANNRPLQAVNARPVLK